MTDKPNIDLSGLEVSDLLDAAYAALVRANDPPVLFQRGARLCRLYEEEDGRVRIEPHGESSLAERLARVANWGATSSQGNWLPKMPPANLVRMLKAKGMYPEVPVLDRVVQVPVLGADGSLQVEPGYHAATRTYYAPASELPREKLLYLDGSKIDELEAEDAFKLLDQELLGDFHFVSSASRAHAWALLLLPFVRELIDSQTPLHVVTAASEGVGKTLLVDAVAYPAAGMEPVMTVAGNEELEKKLVAVLREGVNVIKLDNLQRGYTLRNESLALALTSGTWRARVLGVSSSVQLRTRCAWTLTGVNVSLHRELVRRSVFVGLRSPSPPFRHPHLLSWAKRHRRDLVQATLLLVLFWVQEGAPRWRGKLLPTYEEWSEVVGGVLAFLGVKGFLEDEDLRVRVNDEDAFLGYVLEQWHQTHGERWRGPAEVNYDPVLVNLLEGMAKSVGHWLKGLDGREVNGLRLDHDNRSRRRRVVKL